MKSPSDEAAHWSPDILHGEQKVVSETNLLVNHAKLAVLRRDFRTQPEEASLSPALAGSGICVLCWQFRQGSCRAAQLGYGLCKVVNGQIESCIVGFRRPGSLYELD